MNPTEPIKVSFSFYPADVDALATRVAALKRAGVGVRGATLLRALIYLTPPAEMFAHSVLLAAAHAKKDGPREDDNVAGHPTVDLPKEQVKKLDGVVKELAEKRIVNANRAFVVRAVLRSAPDGKTLAPAVRDFLEEFPNKPRGLSKLRLERKSRARA